MSIPTEEELAYPGCINNPHVCGLFLGKSADAAYAMFRRGEMSNLIGEAMTSMTVRGFEFYLPPAIRYVESDDSIGDWEFLTGVLSAASSRLYHEAIRKTWSPHLPPEPLSEQVIQSIRQLAQYVRLNLKKFEIDENDSFVTTLLLEIDTAPPQ